MSRKTRTLLAVVVAVAALAALAYFAATTFGGPSAQLRELDANERKWSAQAAAHYQFNLYITCFCPFVERMPLTVEVLDDQVLSVLDNQGREIAADDPLRTMTHGDLVTIPKLFGYAENAIREADNVVVTYDPQLGYPTSISVDWIKLAMDDEITYEITELKVLP